MNLFLFYLAFAMTVHKAQGGTIQRVVVDLTHFPCLLLLHEICNHFCCYVTCYYKTTLDCLAEPQSVLLVKASMPTSPTCALKAILHLSSRVSLMMDHRGIESTPSSFLLKIKHRLFHPQPFLSNCVRFELQMPFWWGYQAPLPYSFISSSSSSSSS